MTGVIVNLTSINAIDPSPYRWSKAAVVKLTGQMVLQLGPLGVRVNSLAPGFIDAGMPDFHLCRSSDAGRTIGRRARAAAGDGGRHRRRRCHAFLASDGASYIHGHHLVADGGASVSLLRQLQRGA